MTPKFTVLRRMCTLLPAIGLLASTAVACDDDEDIVGVVPTPVVRTVRDPNFNFAPLRTFAMPDTVAHFAPLTGTPLVISREFDRTVLDQVKANLIARGYVQVTAPATVAPDFVVLVGATAATNYNAYATYSWYPYYGYYSGWGWYAPGFTSDWTLIYPFYPTVGVTSFDRGTFLALRRRLSLVVLFQGDAGLRNVYHAYLVNPAKHPHAKAKEARALIGFGAAFRMLQAN